MTQRSGTVKWFKADTGYGFVAPDGGGKDVFLHVNVVRKAGLDPAAIREGSKVSFTAEAGPKGEKAVSLTLA